MPTVTEVTRLIEQTGPFDKKVVEKTMTWTLRELMEAAGVHKDATVQLLMYEEWGAPIAEPEVDEVQVSITQLFDDKGKPCKLVERTIRVTEVVERSLGYDVEEEEQIDGVNDMWGIDAI